MGIEKWHKQMQGEKKQRERARERRREGELKPLTVQYNMQIRLHYIDVSAYVQLCARGKGRVGVCMCVLCVFACVCACVCVWQHV